MGLYLRLLLSVGFLLSTLSPSMPASRYGYLVDGTIRVRLCPDCMTVLGHPYASGQRVRLYETRDGWTRISDFVSSRILREQLGDNVPSRSAFWVSNRSYVTHEAFVTNDANAEIAASREQVTIRSGHLYNLVPGGGSNRAKKETRVARATPAPAATRPTTTTTRATTQARQPRQRAETTPRAAPREPVRRAAVREAVVPGTDVVDGLTGRSLSAARPRTPPSDFREVKPLLWQPKNPVVAARPQTQAQAQAQGQRVAALPARPAAPAAAPRVDLFAVEASRVDPTKPLVPAPQPVAALPTTINALPRQSNGVRIANLGTVSRDPQAVPAAVPAAAPAPAPVVAPVPAVVTSTVDPFVEAASKIEVPSPVVATNPFAGEPTTPVVRVARATPAARPTRRLEAPTVTDAVSVDPFAGEAAAAPKAESKPEPKPAATPKATPAPKPKVDPFAGEVAAKPAAPKPVAAPAPRAVATPKPKEVVEVDPSAAESRDPLLTAAKPAETNPFQSRDPLAATPDPFGALAETAGTAEDGVIFEQRPSTYTRALRDERLNQLPSPASGDLTEEEVIAIRHHALMLLKNEECSGVVDGGRSISNQGWLYVVCQDDPNYLRQFPLEEVTW